MQSIQKSSTRHTEKQIRSLLHLSQNYSGTITQFCKTHNILKGTFYYWRNKFDPVMKNEVAIKNDAAFIPIQITNHSENKTLFAEIELSPEVTVRLFQRVEATWFKSLL